eukprot:7000204-Pyramimonas_sp.AAC.1
MYSVAGVGGTTFTAVGRARRGKEGPAKGCATCAGQQRHQWLFSRMGLSKGRRKAALSCV